MYILILAEGPIMKQLYNEHRLFNNPIIKIRKNILIPYKQCSICYANASKCGMCAEFICTNCGVKCASCNILLCNNCKCLTCVTCLKCNKIFTKPVHNYKYVDQYKKQINAQGLCQTNNCSLFVCKDCVVLSKCGQKVCSLNDLNKQCECNCCWYCKCGVTGSIHDKMTYYHCCLCDSTMCFNCDEICLNCRNISVDHTIPIGLITLINHMTIIQEFLSNDFDIQLILPQESHIDMTLIFEHNGNQNKITFTDFYNNPLLLENVIDQFGFKFHGSKTEAVFKYAIQNSQYNV